MAPPSVPVNEQSRAAESRTADLHRRERGGGWMRLAGGGGGVGGVKGEGFYACDQRAILTVLIGHLPAVHSPRQAPAQLSEGVRGVERRGAWGEGWGWGVKGSNG